MLKNLLIKPHYKKGIGGEAGEKRPAIRAAFPKSAAMVPGEENAGHRPNRWPAQNKAT
jgi:hypothetical protein